MINNVAVIQMTSCANVLKNLKKIETLLALASSKQVKLVVLPENFAFMGLNEADKLAVAETYRNGPIQLAISEMAKKHRLWIVAGTIPIASDDPARCYASSLVFNAKGECVLRYDKMHLFDVQVSASESHKESNSTCAGTQLKVIDTPVGRVGLSVCYDVRFPEFYRQLREMGADILIVPAAFTFDTGKVHWHTLLKARAIENLSYVVAANQGGEHQNGRKTYGHSMIVSPWGNIESSCSESEVNIAIAGIDIEGMMRTRETFPCLNHRKL